MKGGVDMIYVFIRRGDVLGRIEPILKKCKYDYKNVSELPETNMEDIYITEVTPDNVNRIVDLYSKGGKIIPVVSEHTPKINKFLTIPEKDYVEITSIPFYHLLILEKLMKFKKCPKKMAEKILMDTLSDYGVRAGRSYIIDFNFQNRFIDFIEIYCKLTGEKPVVISRLNIMSGRHEEIKPDVPVEFIWVTDIVGEKRVKPHNISVLTDMVIRYIENGTKVFIMDCVEYVTLYNDFVNVLKNIELVNSYISEYNGMAFYMIDPDAYSKKELSLLKRYMHTLNPEEVLS